jgi:hypothetical protein
MFLLYVFRDIIIQLHFLYNNTRWFNLWFIKECRHSLHNEHFPCFLRNPFWQYQTTEVNNDTLITKTDRTYSNLFIYCVCTSAKCMSVKLKQFEKVYLFIWSHDFRFLMSFSLSPNSLYCQSTDCTEGGGLTREHYI